jgi:hypothetical protein
MSYSSALLTNIINVFSHLSKKSSNFLVCGLFWLNFSIVKANAEDNILVIHSYDPELTETKQQQAGIEQGFAEIGNKSNIFHEFLDSKRHPSPEHKQEFINYVNKKYQRISIDLLMVVGDSSLQLMLRKHDRFFADTPVVFLGINSLRQSLVDTALEATRQMWTDTIVIINDTTETGKGNLEQIQEVKQIENKPLQIEVIEDLLPQEIKTRLGKYPDNVPILLLGQLRQNNSQKTLIDPQQDTQILQSQIPNPIYTENAARLGRGVVGGKVFDTDYHTRQAVKLAQKILQGVSPDEVGPILIGKNRWVFDYRQLLRYHIKLDLLPDDSELLYVEPPFYVKHRTIVLIVALSFLSSVLTIIL